MKVDPDRLHVKESGVPVGEVSFADGTSADPAPTRESVVASDDREIAVSASAAITRDPDADPTIAELYPGYSDAEARTKARSLFVVDSRRYEDVAKAVGVPERTVARWIYDCGWDRLVKQELAVKRSQSLVELERLRATRRTDAARKQLDQAEKIRNQAARAIEAGEVSLKSGTEAWATAAKVEQTILGVAENGSVAGAEEEKKADAAVKQQFVFSFNGGLPPRAEAVSV